MSNQDSIKHIVNKFFIFEKQYSLFHKRIEGVQLYPPIRMRLYYEVMRQLQIFTSTRSARPKQKSKILFNSIKYKLLQNNFVLRNKKCEVLALESIRRDPESGKNIYLCFLLEALQDDYCVIRNSNSIISDLTKEKKVSDSLSRDYLKFKAYLYRKVIRKRIKKEFSDFATIIEKCIRKTICKTLDLKECIYQYLLSSFAAIYVARSLIKKINPKLLIVEDAYGHYAFVDAAKFHNIPVVELQHSIIYPYHLGYAYPNAVRNSIDSFPDFLFSYGDFWRDRASFPIDKSKIISTGFPYFENQQIRWKNTSLNEKQILFISQNTIGSKLIHIAINVANKLPDYKIVYKLHPKQYNQKNALPSNQRGKTPSNLLIFGENSPSLYELFVQSMVQVGVFSTAIYEGLGFGMKKTIICKLPGWEFVENLMSEGYASLAEDANEVVELIKSSSGYGYDSSQLFKSNSVQNMRDEIRKIIGENSL
ncbi:MAG: hypothetical protein GY705_28215 [Bacteroidetes bacterium]|nr:hypothetical protein [Bacteroidota bacterium]